MTVQDLVARIRLEGLDDVKEPYHWSDDHIISALSAAQDETARRNPQLQDSTTTAICRIAVAAVDGVYPRSYALDPRVLRIERVKYGTQTVPLIKKDIGWLDINIPGWDTRTGTPAYYSLDYQSGAITFNAQPIADATVSLSVFRRPLVTLVAAGLAGTPEITDENCLVYGALKNLYLKQDAEIEDTGKYQSWQGLYEQALAVNRQDVVRLRPRRCVMVGTP